MSWRRELETRGERAELFEPEPRARPALYPRTPDIEHSPEYGHNKTPISGAGPVTIGVSSAVTKHALIERRVQGSMMRMRLLYSR